MWFIALYLCFGLCWFGLIQEVYFKTDIFKNENLLFHQMFQMTLLRIIMMIMFMFFWLPITIQALFTKN